MFCAYNLQLQKRHISAVKSAPPDLARCRQFLEPVAGGFVFDGISTVVAQDDMWSLAEYWGDGGWSQVMPTSASPGGRAYFGRWQAVVTYGAQPFSRGRDRGTADPGSGVGLYLAALYVRSLGGRISAESAPGKGSAFRVALPVFRKASNPSKVPV